MRACVRTGDRRTGVHPAHAAAAEAVHLVDLAVHFRVVASEELCPLFEEPPADRAAHVAAEGPERPEHEQFRQMQHRPDLIIRQAGEKTSAEQDPDRDIRRLHKKCQDQENKAPAADGPVLRLNAAADEPGAAHVGQKGPELPAGLGIFPLEVRKVRIRVPVSPLDRRQAPQHVLRSQTVPEEDPRVNADEHRAQQHGQISCAAVEILS